MFGKHSTPILTAAAGVLSVLVWAGSATAHSDIFLDYEAGKLVVHPGHEGLVFEGDFGDFAGGPYETDDPGFNVDTGDSLGANDIIGFNVMGPLLYHNGTGFAVTAATVTFEDAVSTEVDITSATVSASGWVGQASGTGGLHEHLNMWINGHSAAPVGAYGVLLSLSAYDSSFDPRLDIADSDLFYIVFNNGLDETTFENAVGDFAAIVPEPASVLLLLAGGGVMLRRRRKA